MSLKIAAMDHSTSATPPAAITSSLSFSASSFGKSDLTTWGAPSTNFLACEKEWLILASLGADNREFSPVTL